MLHPCPQCTKIFASERALRGHSRVHASTYAASKVAVANTLTGRSRSRYADAPKVCLNCSQEISYEAYRTDSTVKFCSRSCAAAHNNQKRGSRSSTTKEAIRQKLNGRLRKHLGMHASGSKQRFRNFRNAIVGPYSQVFSCTCRHCSAKFLARVKRKYCRTHETLYKDFGRNLYAFTFNPFHFPDIFLPSELNTIRERGFWSPSNKTGLTRDHKVSVNESIRNGYDPYYIKHPLNCALMPWQENNLKNTKSSITYTELVKAVDEYDAQCRGLKRLAPQAGFEPA